MVREAPGYTSGIRPQAGGFSTINRALAAARQGCGQTVVFEGYFRWNIAFSSEVGTGSREENASDKMTFYRPLSRSSTSEEANPSAGAPMEAWNERSASRVWPPNWPSGVPL